MSHLARPLIFRFQRFLQQRKQLSIVEMRMMNVFKWAIKRALNPVEKHSERIDKNLRETSKVFNWEGLEFSSQIE